MTYSGMVSRDTISDSVCLAFIITALNYLDILSGDTQNVNLNAPTKEKVFFYDGDGCNYDQGKVVVIVRAIYGLNFSALAWGNYLSENLGNYLGFQ